MGISESMLKELLNNSVALAAMPEATVSALRSQYEELKRKREEKEARLSEEQKCQEKSRIEMAAKEKAERAARVRKLLGLDIGEWVRNIPNERRFVLAYRIGKRFQGWSGQEKDVTKWGDVDEYIPMDILRGYTAPYFGYCGHWGILERLVTESLIPAVEAKTEDELFKIIERDFNFFSYDHHEEREGPIAICAFTRDANGKLKVTGHGEFKKLSEHLSDLRKEFGNG